MFAMRKKITVIIVLIMSVLFVGCRSHAITGEWIYNGKEIEFLSDGTVFYEGCSDMYPPTYEITEEGYLKVGIYDYAWVTYEYTYFLVENDGDTLTLTDKADADQVYVLVRNDGSEYVEESSDESKENNIVDIIIQTDEEKARAALEKYFAAYNDMDVEAIYNASYPKGTEMDPRIVCENDYDFYECWRMRFGLTRSRYDWFDIMESNPDLPVFEDYPICYEGENGELLDAEGNVISLDEAFPDFSISYEILEMKPFEECALFLREGLYDLHEIDNIDSIIQNPEGGCFDIDSMYVVLVDVEYYYGEDLYGYNKDWWNDERFPYSITYEEEIEEASREHMLYIYEYNGKWYVYHHYYNHLSFYHYVEF